MIDPQAVPLSLYIHLPWCTRKCPYCDFNSHEGFTESLQKPYIYALLADLDSQQAWWRDRPIESIFIGGGTPSLFEGRWLGTLLEGVSNRATLSRHVEITLESNPGSAESSRFAEYRAAGVNRLSIGVQSFDDRALHALGRIHSGNEARRALDMVATAGFQRWNIDLMHGLPGQDAQSGAADLIEAVGRSAGHISWYQLTIERNTRFWSAPPALPNESELESIQQAGEALLSDAGLDQYEVSAFSREGEESRHNIHWIGCGCPWQDLSARRHHYSNPTHPETRRLSCHDDVIAPVTAAGCRDFACGEDHGIRYEYPQAHIRRTDEPLYAHDGRDCRAADRGGQDCGIPRLA